MDTVRYFDVADIINESEESDHEFLMPTTNRLPPKNTIEEFLHELDFAKYYKNIAKNIIGQSSTNQKKSTAVQTDPEVRNIPSSWLVLGDKLVDELYTGLGNMINKLYHTNNGYCNESTPQAPDPDKMKYFRSVDGDWQSKLLPGIKISAPDLERQINSFKADTFKIELNHFLEIATRLKNLIPYVVECEQQSATGENRMVDAACGDSSETLAYEEEHCCTCVIEQQDPCPSSIESVASEEYKGKSNLLPRQLFGRISKTDENVNFQDRTEIKNPRFSTPKFPQKQLVPSRNPKASVFNKQHESACALDPDDSCFSDMESVTSESTVHSGASEYTVKSNNSPRRILVGFRKSGKLLPEERTQRMNPKFAAPRYNFPKQELGDAPLRNPKTSASIKVFNQSDIPDIVIHDVSSTSDAAAAGSKLLNNRRKPFIPVLKSYIPVVPARGGGIPKDDRSKIKSPRTLYKMNEVRHGKNCHNQENLLGEALLQNPKPSASNKVFNQGVIPDISSTSDGATAESKLLNNRRKPLIPVLKSYIPVVPARDDRSKTKSPLNKPRCVQRKNFIERNILAVQEPVIRPSRNAVRFRHMKM